MNHVEIKYVLENDAIISEIFGDAYCSLNQHVYLIEISVTDDLFFLNVGIVRKCRRIFPGIQCSVILSREIEQ